MLWRCVKLCELLEMWLGGGGLSPFSVAVLLRQLLTSDLLRVNEINFLHAGLCAAALL